MPFEIQEFLGHIVKLKYVQKLCIFTTLNKKVELTTTNNLSSSEQFTYFIRKKMSIMCLAP